MSTGGFESAPRPRKRVAKRATSPRQWMAAPESRPAKRVAKKSATVRKSTARGTLHVPITDPDLTFHRWDGDGVELVEAEMDELKGYKVGVEPDAVNLATGWDGRTPGGRQLPFDAGTTIRVIRVVDRNPPDPDVRKAPRVVEGGGELLGHIIEFSFLAKNDSVFRIEKMRGQAIKLWVDDTLVYTWEHDESGGVLDVNAYVDEDEIE